MACEANSTRASSQDIDFERQRLVIEGLDAGIWEWVVASDELFWSPKLYRQLGFEPDEIVPTRQSLEKYVHAEDLDTLHQAICAHMELRLPCSFSCRLRDKKGRYRWYFVRGQAEWDAEGEPIRVVGSVQDISDSRGEERYKSLVVASQDLVWEFDLESEKVIFVNHRVSESLGYAVDEVLSFKISEIFHPETYEEFLQRLPGHISNKDGWTKWVIRIQAKDGEYRYLESTSVPVLNSKDELIGFRGVDRDITDRRLAQIELNDRLQFEMLVSELSASFVRMAHDQVDEVMEQALGRVAQFFSVDQCAMYCFFADGAEFEFSQSIKEDSKTENLLNPRMHELPWALARIQAGDIVRVSEIEDLPDEADAERKFMSEERVHSFFCSSSDIV